MSNLAADETLIVDYLKQFPHTFVSAIEICRRAGTRKRYTRDPEWARPVLRRMEVDGWVDSNEFGQFKLVDAALGDQKCTKADRIERARRAISKHLLQMAPGDDDKPFSVLIREAVQMEYNADTQFFNKNK